MGLPAFLAQAWMASSAFQASSPQPSAFLLTRHHPLSAEPHLKDHCYLWTAKSAESSITSCSGTAGLIFWERGAIAFCWPSCSEASSCAKKIATRIVFLLVAYATKTVMKSWLCSGLWHLARLNSLGWFVRCWWVLLSCCDQFKVEKVTDPQYF